MPKFKKGDIVRCLYIVKDSSTVLDLVGIVDDGPRTFWDAQDNLYKVFYKRGSGFHFDFPWWTSERALELYSEEYPDICEWE